MILKKSHADVVLEARLNMNIYNFILAIVIILATAFVTMVYIVAKYDNEKTKNQNTKIKTERRKK